MKILKLSSENIKRLTAVEITPDGTLVTISGKNGAGKSSVLDSIAYALGGLELVPAEPIRTGQAEAKIEVDLGDLIVTRKFKREHIPGTVVWGETRSTLVVRNKEGASYPSPQAVLDKLLGTLTFDPLDFAEAKPQVQLETLRQLTNLDTSVIDSQRKAAFDRRTLLKKQHADAVRRVKDLPTHPVKETTEVSMAEVSDQMRQAEEARNAADDAARRASITTNDMENEATKRETLQNVLETLELRIAEQMTLIAASEARLKTLGTEYDEAVNAAATARAAIPDTAVLLARIDEIEALNAKIRENQKAASAQQAAAALKAKVDAEDRQIVTLDAKKEELLASVAFPVEGLGFGDAGVTFQGIPFEQASTAEQIRVSVAMGLALNPTIKVLLVRDGSALDVASMTILAEQAAAAEAQIWIERVSESPDGVAIFIDEGSINA